MHLIFSDETNKEMLNEFELSDSQSVVDQSWISLYRSESNQLMPMLTIGGRNFHKICAPKNCTTIIFDPNTGTNRFDCDFTHRCQKFEDLNFVYNYVNDPRTDHLIIMKFTVYEDDDGFISESNMTAVYKNVSNAFTTAKRNRPYGFDATNNVKK